MEFNEANLMNYLQKEGPQCDYLLSKLAEMEAEYERLYSLKFVEFKDEGGTEKYVEARCKSDPVLSSYVYATKKLKGHLKAWDINHDNAQAFGHNLRKELEKLGGDIRFTREHPYDDKIMEIVRATTKETETEV
jgi:hypothetical protein